MVRPDLPRAGPRPLALHLASANWTLLSSLAALPSARHGSLPWKPPLGAAGAELAGDLAAAEPEALSAAVAAAAAARLEAMMQGIAAYRRHPYRRDLPPVPVLWRRGGARLLDYGAVGGGPSVLFVPSLINRAHVLDLSARRSMLRWLAGQGLRPLLLDWGEPGPAERRFGLGDYIEGRLAAALEAAAAAAGGPVGLVGYCMGGTLALAAAERRPERVAALALLAAPWDFHAGDGGRFRVFAAAAPLLRRLLESHGMLPVDAIQALFAGLDPALALRKFAAFAALKPESPEAADFVAVEDWLNDGLPLAGPAAEDCLTGWYGENRPMRGDWMVAGQPVRPGGIRRPALVVLPAADRIVPRAAAAPLARLIPGAEVLAPRAGHIGMVVGGGAESALWRPLAEWLRRRLA